MPNDFPLFDVLVIGIVVFSLLIGLMRGLVHELLSLLSWGGALVVSWFAYPYVAVWLHAWLPNIFLRQVVGGVLAFIVSVIAFGFASSALSKMVNVITRATDRALGGIFGLLRGYIIACLLFAFAFWIWEDRTPLAFLNEGKTRPFIAIGAKELVHLLASYENTPLVLRLRTITETGSNALELHQKLITPQTQESTVSPPEKGYKADERDQLNDLFEQQQ